MICSGALLLATVVPAVTPKELGKCHRTYYRGKYSRSADACAALARNEAVRDEVRERAYMLGAFSAFLIGDETAARVLWLELLVLSPDFELTSRDASPDLLDFFSTLEPEPEPEEPAASDEPPPDGPAEDTAHLAEPAGAHGLSNAATGQPNPAGSGPAVSEIDAESVGTPQPTPGPAVEPAPPGGAPNVAVPCHPLWCAVPFGVGQFVNGDYLKGAVFAVLELGFFGTNIALFWKRKADVGPSGRDLDIEAAERDVLIQRVALGLALGTVVLGIVEAYVDL